MHGAVRVLEHHLLVYRRTWRGTLFSTFLSPVLFMAAMGLGLGAFVDENAPASLGGVPYLVFLAPGLLAAQAMQTASFESTYPVMAGLIWLRTFLAMVTTPIRSREVVLGQLAFVAARLVLVASVFVLVMVAFSATDPLRGVAMVPVAVLTGLAFAAPITAFSGTQRNDAGFSALFRFVITPLFLFSGTFFPVSQLPDLIEPIAYLTPLWHGVALARMISVGALDPILAGANLLVLSAYVVAGAVAAIVVFERRLER
jgi:lipooligosaccharide transport system permease protein